MSDKMRGLVCTGVIAAALSVQSSAHAGVSNPDYYFIDIPASGTDSIFDGGSGGGVVKMDGQLEGDLDSSGNWTFGGAAFTPRQSNISVGGQFVNVQPIVVASGTFGDIDPGNTLVSLTLRMRLKFTNASLGSSCQTALFTVTMSNQKNFLGGTGAYTVNTGQFIAGAQDFTIPAMTGSCNNNHAALNTAFNLGAASGSIAMKIDYGVINNPQVPAP